MINWEKVLLLGGLAGLLNCSDRKNYASQKVISPSIQQTRSLPAEGTLEYFVHFVKNMKRMGKHVEQDKQYIPESEEHYDLEVKIRHPQYQNNKHQLIYFPNANNVWLQIMDLNVKAVPSSEKSENCSRHGWIDITDNNFDLKVDDIFFSCTHSWYGDNIGKYTTLVSKPEAEQLLAKAIKEVVEKEK